MFLLVLFYNFVVILPFGFKTHCYQYFVCFILQLLRTMKGQFAGLLYDTGFIRSSDPKDPASNVNSTNVKLLKSVLCSGLYPNVIKIDQNKPGR